MIQRTCRQVGRTKSSLDKIPPVGGKNTETVETTGL